MNKFKFMWRLLPIDFCEGATIASQEETERVLASMPETPRSTIALKCWVPGAMEFIPVYVCTADNNGTAYLFADVNVFRFLQLNLEPMEVDA